MTAASHATAQQAQPQPQAGTSQTPQPVALAAVKAKQQAAWSSGDYSVVGTTPQIVGEALCEAVDLRSPERVRRVRERQRRARRGSPVRPGDRGRLPPRAPLPRHGGRIGLANWTPDGFVGQMFKAVGAHVPPPAGLRPALWGTENRLTELFGTESREIRARAREFTFRYRSPAHWPEVFRTCERSNPRENEP